jgi:hypothetical protein
MPFFHALNSTLFIEYRGLLEKVNEKFDRKTKQKTN